MFGRIVLGLVIMVLGGAMIYFSANLVEMFGRSSWAEDKFGGTRQMWVVFGVGMFIIGGLVMMGVINFSDPTSVNTTGF